MSVSSTFLQLLLLLSLVLGIAASFGSRSVQPGAWGAASSSEEAVAAGTAYEYAFYVSFAFNVVFLMIIWSQSGRHSEEKGGNVFLFAAPCPVRPLQRC